MNDLLTVLIAWAADRLQEPLQDKLIYHSRCLKLADGQGEEADKQVQGIPEKVNLFPFWDTKASPEASLLEK